MLVIYFVVKWDALPLSLTLDLNLSPFGPGKIFKPLKVGGTTTAYNNPLSFPEQSEFWVGPFVVEVVFGV